MVLVTSIFLIGDFFSQKEVLVHEVAARSRIEKLLKESKEAAEAAYEKLKDLESTKNNLIHMIIHDLNNPLTVIYGELQLLRLESSDVLTKQQKESMDIALLSVQDLQRMIGNLLDINKMEEGKIKLHLETFMPCDIAEEISSQMKIIATSNVKWADPNSAMKDLARGKIALAAGLIVQVAGGVGQSLKTPHNLGDRQWGQFLQLQLHHGRQFAGVAGGQLDHA